MNLATGEVTKVIDTEFKTGHIQASRFTPGEIVFCNETGGDAYQRMWFCTADGSVFKPLYKETPLDWVTHETFVTKDYVYFNILGFQPRLRKQVSGIARINLRTDDVELVGQVELDKDRKAIEGQLTGRGFCIAMQVATIVGQLVTPSEEMSGSSTYRPVNAIG